MLHSALRDIQQIGYMRFIRKLVYFKWHIFHLDVDITRFADWQSASAVETQPIERVLLPEIESFIKPLGHYGAHPQRILDEYVEGGCKGYAAIESGKIIGFVWFADKFASPHFSSPIMQYTWEVFLKSDADVFLFDIYIDPDHRKHHKGLNLSKNFLHALSKIGHSNGAAFVFQNNMASLKMLELLNFQLVKKIAIRRLFALASLRGSKLSFELFKSNFWSDLIDEMKT